MSKITILLAAVLVGIGRVAGVGITSIVVNPLDSELVVKVAVVARETDRERERERERGVCVLGGRGVLVTTVYYTCMYMIMRMQYTN